MRGQRVYKEIIKGSGISNTIHRGRNNSLVSKRNECLAARYYYWGFYKNLSYEEILRLLVSEFFLSPVTIGNIILGQTEYLAAMKQKGPSLYYLQTRWPHLKW